MYTDYPEWTLSVPCGGFGISPSWGQSDFSFESWFPISKTRELNGGRGSSPPPPYMRQRGQKGRRWSLLWSSSSGRRQGPGLGCTVSPTFLMVFTLSVPGSLAVSVADMTAPVVGSSGGVYALVSAHLANIVMVSSPCSLLICPVSPLPSLGLDVIALSARELSGAPCPAGAWFIAASFSASPFQLRPSQMYSCFLQPYLACTCACLPTLPVPSKMVQIRPLVS